MTYATLNQQMLLRNLVVAKGLVCWHLIQHSGFSCYMGVGTNDGKVAY